MRTLSSSFTFFYKYVFSLIWISGFGIGTFTAFMNKNDSDQYVFLFFFIFGTILIYLVCARIKKVQLEGNSLIISNYIQSIEVDLSDVKSISGSILLTPELIWFKLRSPTIFGQTIIFMPRFRFFGGFTKHPMVEELQAIVPGEY